MLRSKLKHLRAFCTHANSSIYVTTPIFYVNAAPHIGHLYSAVIADAICRYKRLQAAESNIHFCTGTDEHGTKIQQAAAKHNVPVAQYCNEISQRYADVFKSASINHTDFIRTTEQRHKEAVGQFWQTLQNAGHIYSAQYSGWYCVSDETFLTDSQLKLNEATGARHSLESGHSVEWTEETNYMFRLSAMQSEVLRWLQQGGRVRPLKFERILMDMLSEPLPDVSVSRPASRVHWGISVPNDASQTVYVWLDALINYLTSAGYPDAKFSHCWPPNVQVIGKDILKFHGIYWPAFLMAADIEPPKQLFVHSHWTVDDQKMSKSKNNVVDPVEASNVYTMEGLRYFLLREGVAHSDGNYSSTKALRILNSELADTLGNLLSRACAKSLNPQQSYPCARKSMVDDLVRQLDAAKRLQESLMQLQERCQRHYEDNNFYLVADTVMSTLHATNNFFESARPWELKSKNVQSNATTAAEQQQNAMRLQTIIAMTMDALRLCGIVLQPIVPQLSAKLLDKLSVPLQQRLWCNLDQHFASCSEDNHYAVEHRALSTETDAVLFRRIQMEDTADNALSKKSISKQPLQPTTKTPAVGKKKSKKPRKDTIAQ